MATRCVLLSMAAWLLAGVGCGGGYPDPDPHVPDAPTTNDPAFTAKGLHSWYLIGNAATPGDDELTTIITAPAGTKYVDAYLGDQPPVRMIDQADGFAMQVSIADLPAGDHDLRFSADGDTTAFAHVTVHRSAPYYVLVSTDYDFSDPGTYAVGYMDWLHRDHPGMQITHFWAPYTYTDPAVTEARRTELDTWIRAQRDTFGDEIALHIHPYCNFVEDAGVTCITDQSTVYPTDDTGYTIKLSAYGHDDMSTLLQHAIDLFGQRQLGRPTTFRAGGWTADLETLRALADNGFVADTSALNWARIEEWQGKELYTWNMTHWAPIDDTSQPYWPSASDVLSSTPAPDLTLLEVPDNGVMIDYVTLEEMTGLFDANWDGAALPAPRPLMMGFHPAPGFTQAEYKRVDDFLSYSDAHLATADLGPVVYITLAAVTKAFPTP